MFSMFSRAFVALFVILFVMQVHSKLRSGQDASDFDLQAYELDKRDGPPSIDSRYNGECMKDSDCSFQLFRPASMKCCTSGKDINTCHFMCNFAHQPKEEFPQTGMTVKSRAIDADEIGQNNNVNGITVLQNGQMNTVEGVTIASIAAEELGQNNAVGGIAVKEIGQNNNVNGITIPVPSTVQAASFTIDKITSEEIGQHNSVNGVTIGTDNEFQNPGTYSYAYNPIYAMDIMARKTRDYTLSAFEDNSGTYKHTGGSITSKKSHDYTIGKHESILSQLDLAPESHSEHEDVVWGGLVPPVVPPTDEEPVTENKILSDVAIMSFILNKN